MKPTIKMVADLAGVSKACVSKYLNNKPYVSKKTSLKIKKIIEELDYKPDFLARSFSKQKSYSIGLIIRDIQNPYYGGIIKGIENYIAKNEINYHLIISDIEFLADPADQFLNNLVERRVDGLITTTEIISSKYLAYLKKIKLPLVFLGCYIKNNLNYSYVGIDDYLGGYIISEHLLNLGHRDIKIVSPSLCYSFANDRISGHKKALKDFNLKFNSKNIYTINDWSIQGGFEAANKIFKSKNIPSAIFCINDYVAYGVINYCYTNNIRIPDDVSITGFDDNVFSNFPFIKLTTIKEPVEKLGNIAAEILLKQIYSKDISGIKETLKPNLIIRNSTRAIKNN